MSGRHLLANMLFGALLLPFAAPPNTYGQIYPLNGQSWSLLQEYLANIAYVLLAPRLGQRALQVLAAVSAVALVAAALVHGNLHGNWGWDNFWMGPVRLVFPFTMELLLFRQRISLRVPRAFWVLSLVLLAVFAGPSFQPAGLYAALCVIVVFPLVIAAGAGAAPSRGSRLPSAAGAAGSRIRCTCCATRLLRFSLTGWAQRTPHWLSLS